MQQWVTLPATLQQLVRTRTVPSRATVRLATTPTPTVSAVTVSDTEHPQNSSWMPLLWLTNSCNCYFSDIDECALGIDTCEQICSNNPGSFVCSCFPGYTFDGSNCILSKRINIFVLWLLLHDATWLFHSFAGPALNETCFDLGCQQICAFANETAGIVDCFCNPGFERENITEGIGSSYVTLPAYM